MIFSIRLAVFLPFLCVAVCCSDSSAQSDSGDQAPNGVRTVASIGDGETLDWAPPSVRVYAGPDVVQPVATEDGKPALIVAEGEFFRVASGADWTVVHQDDSYGSHSYGGMWTMNGGLLGAPAESVDAVAVRRIQVAEPGAYRVWSKYQAPPYFNYRHRIEVSQAGKVVYSYDYGGINAERFYSFAGAYKAPMIKQQWWFWGVDHDAAEAPKNKFASLAAGEAEIRLTTLKQDSPAGDRFIDSVILTTEPSDTYDGYQPYRTGSPFAHEAIAASQIWMRFKNNAGTPTQMKASTAGHMQPLYGGQSGTYPVDPVQPGQWSEWFNIAAICRMVHEEGVFVTLPAGVTFDVEVARDSAGRDKVSSLKVENDDAIVLPIDVAWNLDAEVKTARQHASDIGQKAKTQWRRANNGQKPKRLAYYGAFRRRPPSDWVDQFKDSLGYNTQLLDRFEHLKRDGYHQHTHNKAELERYVAGLTEEQKANFRILSFGDEIHISKINYGDEQYVVPFRQWLKKKELTADDLGGINPSAAVLSDDANQPRLRWYSNIWRIQFRSATPGKRLRTSTGVR